MIGALGLLVAVAWLLVPVVCMAVLGERYTRRWDRLEHRLVAYVDSRVTGRHRASETLELPLVVRVPGRGAGPARLPDEYVDRWGRR